MQAGAAVLVAAINKHLRTLTVGDYDLDVRSERAMEAHYRDVILNYRRCSGAKEILLPRTEWLFEPRVTEVLPRLRSVLDWVCGDRSSAAQPKELGLSPDALIGLPNPGLVDRFRWQQSARRLPDRR